VRRADRNAILVTGISRASVCHGNITVVGSSPSDRVVVARRRVASAGHRRITVDGVHVTFEVNRGPTAVLG
jgi:hypothetical protein